VVPDEQSGSAQTRYQGRRPELRLDYIKVGSNQHVDFAFVQANLEVIIVSERANCISEGDQGGLDAVSEIRIISVCRA
jgi:hypothetical protein